MNLFVAWLVWSVLATLPVGAHAGDLNGRTANIEDILASLEANALSANEIRAIKSYDEISVIDLTAFVSADENEAIEATLRETDDGWAMVQTE